MLAKLVRKAASGETPSDPLCLWNEEREATISAAELADSLETAAIGETAASSSKTTRDGTTDAREAVGGTNTSMSKPACSASTDEAIHETVDPTLASAVPSPILLLGEQVAMCSLRTHVRTALAQAGLLAPVVVATRFSADPALAKPGDLSEIGERELIAWARKNPGFTWVGDPLSRGFPPLPAIVPQCCPTRQPQARCTPTLRVDLQAIQPFRTHKRVLWNAVTKRHRQNNR